MVSPGLAIAIGLAVLILLLAIETPVAFALMGAGTLGVVLTLGVDVAGNTLAATAYSSTARFGLIVIPLFVLMGLFVSQAGIAGDLFDIADRVVGERVPGALGIATVLACALFAAVTGSSVATVATVGRVAIHEMIRRGYPASLAAGIVAAAGTLGILIPPSIALVIYGVISGESIGLLLIAGAIPGAISAVAYGISIAVLARSRADATPQSRAVSGDTSAPKSSQNSARSRAITSGEPAWSAVAYVAVIFVIVIGGLYAGAFTATEAGGVGAFLAFMLLVRSLIGKRRPIRGLIDSLQEASSMTSMIFALLIGGGIFSFFLVSAGAPAKFAEFVLKFNLPPLAIAAVILVSMAVLGMVLDGFSILLITIPLAYPVLVDDLGLNGIWFGILAIKMIELGLITPPLGINVYVVAGISEEVTVEEAFRGVVPFFVVDILTVALLFLIPSLTTWVS